MSDDLTQRIARNLLAALKHSNFTSERALAKAAHVSDATVRNILRPAQRPPNSKRDPSPQVATLEKLADQLNLSVWQLLYAEFDPDNPPRAISEREADLYSNIRKSLSQIQLKDPQ